MNKNYVSWKINTECNFNCDYCYQNKTSLNKIYPIEIAKKLKCTLDKTSKQWNIGITGGEPLIIPDIIDIIKLLTK